MLHTLILMVIAISVLCIIVLLSTLCQLCFKCATGCFQENNSPPPRNSLFCKYEEYSNPKRDSKHVKSKKPTQLTPIKRNNTKRYSIQYKKLLKQRMRKDLSKLVKFYFSTTEIRMFILQVFS